MSLAGRHHSLSGLYRHHFRDQRRERMFLSSVSFFLTFATVRGITHAIRAGLGPFHNLTAGRTHVHHLVPGILLVELVGYLWLLQLATGDRASRRGDDGDPLWSGIGAHLGRVRPVAKPGRRLLGARGAREHRRNHSLRRAALNWWLGRPFLSRGHPRAAPRRSELAGCRSVD